MIIGKEMEKKNMAIKAMIEITSIQVDVIARRPIRITASITTTNTAALMPRNAAVTRGTSAYRT